MSNEGKGYSINQTFVVEPVDVNVLSISACTALYSNFISSCSGDTSIIMGNGVISFDGALYTNNNISGETIYASTYYSGGTNIIDIINNINVVGGDFDNNTDTLTLHRGDSSTVIVTGFTDYYTTGTTIIGDTIYFNRIDALSAYTMDLSFLSGDTYVTGVTFNNNQLLIVRNDGINLSTFINSFTGLTINGDLITNTLSASTYYNLPTDVYITGGTYSNGGAIFTNNTGGTFNITGFYTGETSDIDVYVTGGTYSNGSATFTNNTGGTFNIVGFYTGETTDIDVYVTGGTYSNGSAIFTNNTGGTFSIAGFYTGTTDIYVTGATYSNGSAIFTNNTGGTFIVAGFYTGATDIDVYVTGGTYSNGTTILYNNTGGTLSISGYYTGGTDIHTTGFTYDGANNLTISNNSGSSYSVNINTMTGLTVNGVFSATTYQNLPTDIRVTGGTYSNGSTIFTNNTGGTFSISGFYTGATDVYVTGGTYNNANSFAFTNNTGGTFNVLFNTVTGLTVGGSFSAVTYQGNVVPYSGANSNINLATFNINANNCVSNGTLITANNITTHLTPTSTRFITITGATGQTIQLPSASALTVGSTFEINNNTTNSVIPIIDFGGNLLYNLPYGGYVNVFLSVNSGDNGTWDKHLSLPPTSYFGTTGLTISGNLMVNNISATTVSATTYLNMPDIRVTGGTYSNNSFAFTNNTGGTFSVLFNTVSGLTVNGNIIATTISATTYQGMQDIKVTGGTYNSTTGVATFMNNTGGTFTVNGFYTGTTLNFITTSDSTPINATASTYAQSVSIPPNSFAAGDIIEIKTKARKTGVIGTQLLRFYVCTGQTLSGAILLGTGTAAANTTIYASLLRSLVIKDATGNTETFPSAIASQTDEGTLSTATATSNAINWTIQQYIIVAVQDSSASDSTIISSLKATKFR